VSFTEKLLDWSVVGSYGSLGHRWRKQRFRDPDLDVDLSGRTIAVTGASAGLGETLVGMFVERGAHVLAVCRDRARGEAALARVAARPERSSPRHSTAPGRAELVLADLSRLRDVHALAGALQKRPPIDAFVHNAAVLPSRASQTEDGHPASFVTNLLAPYLLTRALAPTLALGARGEPHPGPDSGRFVFVVSGGMYTVKLDLEEALERRVPFVGARVYAQHKRALVLVCERFARELGPHVSCNAVHPGWADTPGVQTSLPTFRALTRPLLRTPEEGAEGVAWLTISDEVASATGKLFFDREERAKDVVPWTATSDERAAELFALLERFSS
jgi:NAD(P)-dependent dehydrogenase (short-subunit alcohol dehydrogenase family)